MVYKSIWEETPHTLNFDEVRYRLILLDKNMQEQEVVFEGRAKRAPDENTITLFINSICQFYLSSECNPEIMEKVYTEGFILENAIRVFRLDLFNEMEETWEEEENFCFLNDWSYKYVYRGESNDISLPVNGHYALGMPLITTNVNQTAPAALTREMEVVANPHPGEYSTLACGDFCLIYQNSRGGIDCFLIEGNVIRTANQTHRNFLKAKGLNRREISTYQNEIVDTWVFNTGWLSDSESEVFADNALLTQQAWLYDIAKAEAIPVEITDSAVKYKTYQNEGKKLANYEVNLKASGYKYRNN